jgi:hypothetical protein
MKEQFISVFQQELPLSDVDHDRLLAAHRRSYATLLLSPCLGDADLIKIVVRLLAVTTDEGGREVTEREKRLEDRLIARLLAELPVRVVLHGLRELVPRRINNRRASSTVRSYLLGAPQLPAWVVRHRGLIRRLLRHAMGRGVTQSCVHLLRREGELAPHQRTYLRRHLYRYRPEEPETLRELFLFLFGALPLAEAALPPTRRYLRAAEAIHHGRGLPLSTLKGIAHSRHGRQSPAYLKKLALSDKVKREAGLPSAEDPGVVAALRRYYLASSTAEQLDHTLRRLDVEIEGIPSSTQRVAVVTDLSRSMRGSGDRLHNNLAIAVGLRHLLARRFDATLIDVGGEPGAPLPSARGGTDLAGGLVAALEVQPRPRHVVLISDGYDNRCEGDADAVLEMGALLGGPAVIHVVPAFTAREDLGDRPPLPRTHRVLETGERGLWGAWIRLQLAMDPEGLFDRLARHLARLEQVEP